MCVCVLFFELCFSATGLKTLVQCNPSRAADAEKRYAPIAAKLDSWRKGSLQQDASSSVAARPRFPRSLATTSTAAMISANDGFRPFGNLGIATSIQKRLPSE